VQTAFDGTVDIIAEIEELNLPVKTESKLVGPLDQTVEFLSDDNPDNDNGVCGQLNVFKKEVVKPKNEIDQETQDELIQAAESLQTHLRCSN